MALRIGFIIATCLKCLLSFSFILALNDSDANLQPLFYFTEEPGGVVYGRRGASICLNCSARCAEPGPVTIRWRKDDRNFTNQSRRYVLANGTLCIERLRQPYDEGIYECLASHQLGTIVSPKVKLELASISSVSINPVNVSCVEGESVRFQCLVTGTTALSVIEWENNGQSISTDDDAAYRLTVLEHLGVLQIVNVTMKDEGQYRCIVDNQTSSTATLKVTPATGGHEVGVVLLGRPKDQDVIHLQTLVLECFLTGLPAPEVTWTKQGSALQQKENVHQFGSGNLMITEVDEPDAGIYTCSWIQRRRRRTSRGAGDDDGDETSSSAQANITVSVPPQLILSDSILPYTSKRREQIVRLLCQFYSWPLPHITWLKNGQRLEQTTRIRMDGLGELTISPTRASDVGMYQCRAENRVGMDQASTFLDFESTEYAPFPPIGVVATVNKTSIRLSWRDPSSNRQRNVSAYCVHIAPTKVDGQEIQNVLQRGVQSGGSMEVENLRPYTNYTVYVVAYNTHGGSNPSRKLNVTTADDVPLSFPTLQLVPLDTSSVRLNWKELPVDQARGVVTEYKILFRKHGSQTFQQVPLQPLSTEYVLKGLEANTKYEIMAAARTSAGYPPLVASSLPWVLFLTNGHNQSEAPDAPEMNAFAIEDVVAAIFVNWTAGNQSVPTLGYKLFCQISSLMESEEPVELGPGTTSYLFSNLEPSTVYQLRLLAFNRRGESQASVQTVRTTGTTVEGGRVNRPPMPSVFSVFEAEAVNSSAISVRWKKPTTLLNVVEYTVRYRRTSPPLVEANGSVYKYLKSFADNLIVGNLDPFSTYEFAVETRGSLAVRSQAIKCQTNEAVPSVPLDLDVTLVGSGVVHLQWNPPAKKNGIITKYLILYTPVQDWPLAHWFTKAENGTLLSTTVYDLRSSAVYYFQVQAATSAGYGPLSDVAHISLGAAAAGGLSDQDLGIVIGTSIGVTCIIICTCIIVLRNRCCPVAPVAMASAGVRVANGTVSSCRCHSVNCTAEFHVLHPSADIDARDDSHLQLANNEGLIENKHCDTKGGNVPNGRNPRFLGQKCSSQSPIVPPKELPENNGQAIPLLETDGRPRRSSEDILDLEGIDYEEDTADAEKVTLMHEGKQKQASYSRHDTTTPANHDRLLGGNLPSRKANNSPAEGKNSNGGKVEEGDDGERNDDCVNRGGSDVQTGSDCNREEQRLEERCSSRCNGLNVTNCKCHVVENQSCSSHVERCDNDRDAEEDTMIGDCDNGPDNHRCYGDRDDDVIRSCHDNHNCLGHPLGCVDACDAAERSKNNNVVAPRDVVSLASESITNWEPTTETVRNCGNDCQPLVSNMVFVGTDCHGNLSKTLPTSVVVDNSDTPIIMND